jgi:HEAT repeat protein
MYPICSPRHINDDQIVRRLGSKGVDLLNLILTRSEKPEVRQDAMETVVSMGEVARRWSLNVLETREKESDSVKNALAILREVGQANADTEKVRKFANWPDPHLQEEALNTLMSFNAKDLEPFIINALSSPDDKLRWRALTALGKLDTLSRESTQQLLRIITADAPQDKVMAATHCRNIAQLIQALGTANNFPALDLLEIAIIKAVQKTVESGKGLITRLTKKNPKEDQTTVLIAAFGTLGKIGSSKSGEFLADFSKGKSTIALEAQKALQLIAGRADRRNS